MFYKVLLSYLSLMTGCYFLMDLQYALVVCCTMACFMISIWLTTNDVTCENCGIIYNTCGNSHCCYHKKVYVNAICDTNGNIFTYTHCCDCNNEFSDDWDDHACFKNN